MKKLAFLSFVFFLSLTFGKMPLYAEDATILDNVEQIYVRITQPFVAGSESNTTSQIVDLPEDAINLGLDNMELLGQVSTEKAEDGTLIGTIDWTSARSTGSEQVTKTLANPLTSEFTSEDQEQVESGVKLLAVGDLKILADDLVKLDNEAAEANKDSSDEKTSTSVSGLTPSSAPSSSGSDNAQDSLEVKSDVQTTTYEECTPFIDEGGLVVNKQRKTIVTGESGKVYSTSMCENYDKLADIKKRPGECGYQFDFDAGLAKEMEQWYYVDPSTGEETLVGTCRESGNTIEIEQRCDQTYCPDYFDEANGLVFPQCTKGIMVGETWFPAPSDCQPQDGVSYSVEWEYVMNDNGTPDDDTDDFIVTHDDFTNGISYPLIRKYYIHPTNGKTYLTEEVQSATESYPHKHETSLCGWEMNDEELKAQELSNTYIETSLGTRELQECAARTAPVPYAYVGLKDHTTNFLPLETNDWQSYTPPSGVTKLKTTVVGGGGYGDRYYLQGSLWGVGGSAGQIMANRTISINDGESIPFYVGKGGFYTIVSTSTPNGFPTLHKYGVTAAENSQVGKSESSSFTPITAIAAITASTLSGTLTGSTNGVTTAVIHGGTGAPGFDIGDGTTGGTAERTTMLYRSSCASVANCSRIALGIGGPGGLGYGAGGGSASGFASSNNYSSLGQLCGGDGAPGLIQFTYQVMRYLRPDGTQYDVIYNGD